MLERQIRRRLAIEPPSAVSDPGAKDQNFTPGETFRNMRISFNGELAWDDLVTVPGCRRSHPDRGGACGWRPLERF
jgi:hypothetical protein